MKELPILIVAIILATSAHARSVDTCVEYGKKHILILKKHLDKITIPYYARQNIICVPEENGKELLDITYKLFPPQPSTTSIKSPTTPDEMEMNRIKFKDRSKNIAFINELKKENIYTLTDDNGYVWYDNSKEVVVRDIILEVADQ